MEKFPPAWALPQVATEPSLFSTAKASRFGNCLPLPVRKAAPDPGRSFGRIFGGFAFQSAYWAWVVEAADSTEINAKQTARNRDGDFAARRMWGVIIGIFCKKTNIGHAISSGEPSEGRADWVKANSPLGHSLSQSHTKFHAKKIELRLVDY